MLSNFNLRQLIIFPFEDSEARKNFLIAILINYLNFVIPMLPYLFLYGYFMRIMRQVIGGENPRMPAWENWEALLTDGAKFFGISMLLYLPYYCVVLPLVLILVGVPTLATEILDESFPYALWLIPSVIGFLIFLSLSILMAVIAPVPEAHLAASGEFNAGFRIREWLPILRNNLVGFILVYFTTTALWLPMILFFVAALITVILFCVFPLILPPLTTYALLIQYTLYAQAYAAGRDKAAALAASEPGEEQL